MPGSLKRRLILKAKSFRVVKAGIKACRPTVPTPIMPPNSDEEGESPEHDSDSSNDSLTTEPN